MRGFKVLFSFDVTGVAYPPFLNRTGEGKIGISPGTTGYIKPDGGVDFHLEKGRTFTAAGLPQGCVEKNLRMDDPVAQAA